MNPQNTPPVQNIISKALQSNRLAHAYLIVDQRTNARRELVKQIASLLLCKGPVNDPEGLLKPCKTCISCKKIAHSVHPDLLEIIPNGRSIKIEQIRQIQKEVTFPPLEGKRRVVIIDRAEAMGPSSSNALLKILEEPPIHTVLLLSTSSSSSLLPTILSRCQILRQVYIQPNINKTDKTNQRLNSFLNFLENELAIEGQAGFQDAVELREKLFHFIGSQNRELTFFETSCHLSSSKEMVKLTVAIINSIIRDIFLIRHLTNNNKEEILAVSLSQLINQDVQGLLIRLARGLNYDTLTAYVEKLALAQAMIDRNVRTEMIIDMLLAFWLRAAP